MTLTLSSCPHSFFPPLARCVCGDLKLGWYVSHVPICRSITTLVEYLDKDSSANRSGEADEVNVSPFYSYRFISRSRGPNSCRTYAWPNQQMLTVSSVRALSLGIIYDGFSDMQLFKSPCTQFSCSDRSIAYRVPYEWLRKTISISHSHVTHDIRI